MPSLAVACAASVARSSQAASSGSGEAGPCNSPSPDGSRLDSQSTYYLVNPAGDLAATQLTFQPWFHQLPGWQVHLAALHLQPAAPFCLPPAHGLPCSVM